ncbi:MAG: hypothetical protein ABII01_06000 [Candidatus Woesearchaeota archaeon]
MGLLEIGEKGSKLKASSENRVANEDNRQIKKSLKKEKNEINNDKEKKGRGIGGKPIDVKENIETNLDLIYWTVLEKKTSSLSSLAQKIGVSTNKIEEWAIVLHKQGLLELNYPVVGDPVLRVKGVKIEKEGKKSKNKDKNKEDKKEKKKELKSDKEKVGKKHILKLLIFAIVVILIAGAVVYFLVRQAK